MNDNELKPCPFCKGKATYISAQNSHAGIDMVMCIKCGCRFYNPTVEKWNTRRYT